MAQTSAIKVESTSWVSRAPPVSMSMEFRMDLVTPIILSHEPPMWEEWGGLNLQTTPVSPRKVLICGSFTLMRSMPSSFVAPTKLEPQSDLYSFTAPLSAWNLLMAFMKLDEDISSTSSMCTPRQPRQVNKMPQRFEFALPPRVRRLTTSNGPNASTPTKLNGGEGFSRASGKSAIFCTDIFPRSLQHLTHLCNSLDISRLPPVIQNPAALTSPSVRCLPWCCTVPW